MLILWKRYVCYRLAHMAGHYKALSYSHRRRATLSDLNKYPSTFSLSFPPRSNIWSKTNLAFYLELPLARSAWFRSPPHANRAPLHRPIVQEAARARRETGLGRQSEWPLVRSTRVRSPPHANRAPRLPPYCTRGRVRGARNRPWTIICWFIKITWTICSCNAPQVSF